MKIPENKTIATTLFSSPSYSDNSNQFNACWLKGCWKQGYCVSGDFPAAEVENEWLGESQALRSSVSRGRLALQAGLSGATGLRPG